MPLMICWNQNSEFRKVVVSNAATRNFQMWWSSLRVVGNWNHLWLTSVARLHLLKTAGLQVECSRLANALLLMGSPHPKKKTHLCTSQHTNRYVTQTISLVFNKNSTFWSKNSTIFLIRSCSSIGPIKAVKIQGEVNPKLQHHPRPRAASAMYVVSGFELALRKKSLALGEVGQIMGCKI